MTESFELQKRVVAARKADAIGDVLLLCEHPHVITLGRSGKRENLLASERVLAQKGVEFHATNRGGDITYHGPGQIVGYPVIQLAAIRRDVVWYVRMLEEVMIRTCGGFWDYGAAGRGEDRSLDRSAREGFTTERAEFTEFGECGGGKNRRDWGAYQPVGYVAWICV